MRWLALFVIVTFGAPACRRRTTEVDSRGGVDARESLQALARSVEARRRAIASRPEAEAERIDEAQARARAHAAIHHPPLVTLAR